LSAHKNNISYLILVPSSEGVFEVKFRDELIFSKKELDRFPEELEIESIIREKI
jgi:selenoprotein W-related protein